MSGLKGRREKSDLDQLHFSSPRPEVGTALRMRNGEHQDFFGPHFVDDEVRELLRDRAMNRQVLRDRFEVRVARGMLLDAEQCVVEDLQKPTPESGLPAFIPSRRGVGLSFREVQESNGQTHGDFSFRSDSIS